MKPKTLKWKETCGVLTAKTPHGIYYTIENGVAYERSVKYTNLMYTVAQNLSTKKLKHKCQIEFNKNARNEYRKACKLFVNVNQELNTWKADIKKVLTKALDQEYSCWREPDFHDNGYNIPSWVDMAVGLLNKLKNEERVVGYTEEELLERENKRK